MECFVFTTPLEIAKYKKIASIAIFKIEVFLTTSDT